RIARRPVWTVRKANGEPQARRRSHYERVHKDLPAFRTLRRVGTVHVLHKEKARHCRAFAEASVRPALGRRANGSVAAALTAGADRAAGGAEIAAVLADHR